MIHLSFESKLHVFLWNKVKELKEEPLMINGMPDHLHILLKMSSTQNVAKLVKDLKGSSSRFMNDLLKQDFEWSRGYGAFTVSKKDMDMIANYIKNQKEHHNKGTVDEELDDFSKGQT